MSSHLFFSVLLRKKIRFGNQRYKVALSCESCDPVSSSYVTHAEEKFQLRSGTPYGLFESHWLENQSQCKPHFHCTARHIQTQICCTVQLKCRRSCEQQCNDKGLSLRYATVNTGLRSGCCVSPVVAPQQLCSDIWVTPPFFVAQIGKVSHSKQHRRAPAESLPFLLWRRAQTLLSSLTNQQTAVL